MSTRDPDTPTAESVNDGLVEQIAQVLVYHQRRDIGSCICGWGVDNGNLGQSHADHVARFLCGPRSGLSGVLVDAADVRARALEDAAEGFEKFERIGIETRANGAAARILRARARRIRSTSMDTEDDERRAQERYADEVVAPFVSDMDKWHAERDRGTA